MMDYKLYSPIPSVLSIETQGPLPEAPPQVGYDLDVVQANRRGLKAEDVMLKKKYEKYTKILN